MRPAMRLSRIPAATRTAKPPARGFGLAGTSGGVGSVAIDDRRGKRTAEFAPNRRGTIPRLMPNHDPIRIAGAGPSGLAAAIALARAGREVEVHEAKRDVGTRFIGDLQIIEGSSEREPVPQFLDRIGIARNFYFRPANWATFYDAANRPRVIRSGEPYGYFIRRGAEDGTLDRGLLAQARDAGARILFNSRLTEADIIATGPATPDGLAKEMTWKTDEPERVDVFFNHHLSPGGYSYLFILDGIATFGCAIVADFKKIDDYFDHSLAAVRRVHPF